jgi:hypothetical protein
MGGERFGITTARANWRAVSPTTAASIDPSRRWTCQSSGWRKIRRPFEDAFKGTILPLEFVEHPTQGLHFDVCLGWGGTDAEVVRDPLDPRAVAKALL